MRMIAIVPLAFALAGPAASAPDWSAAPRVEVELSSFSYQPKRIHLRAGQPVTLHLVNSSSSGHSFTAPEFFASASPRPGAGPLPRSVELSGREVRDLALVPKAGSYRLKCTHKFHKLLGMKGEIVVE